MTKGKRLAELCSGVQRFNPEVMELAKSVLFMEDKLEETRKLIKDEPLVIEYNNGGGQSGIRENPSFSSYEKLFATYSKGLDALMKIVNANGDHAVSVSSFEDRRARLRMVK